MGVDVGDAGRGAPATDNVGHAVRCHRPGETKPELGPILVAVARPRPEVSIERLRRPPPEGAGSLPATLAQHERDVLLEIDVSEPQVRQLRQAHARVEE